jgi:predicted outer membrane protein
MKIETFRLSLAVVLAIGLSPVVANAQQQNQARSKGGQSQQGTNVTQASDISPARLFATELALANHCEVRLAQMASDQSKNQRVKQYAQTLIRDHQQLNRDLVRLFPEIGQIEGTAAEREVGLRGGDSTSANGQDNRSAVQQVIKTAGTRVSQSSDLMAELIGICTEASNIRFEMSKELLSQYQGQDFDMAFVGQELACHVAMVAKLQAINNSKVETEDLQTVLVKAEETARQHLELAKQLCKQLNNGDTTR